MLRSALLGFFLYILTFNPSDAKVPSFIALGCYKDKVANRALPEMIANYRGQIDWTDTAKTIIFCAQAAAAKGYEYFGIQFYGECWSGKTAGQTYATYGPSENCWESVGMDFANFVFKFATK